MANTVKDLADSNNTLKMASADCMQAAADHEATVKGRKEELTAIATAKTILTDSSSGAESQTYSLLQAGAAECGR